jgi:hypothetical protein
VALCFFAAHCGAEVRTLNVSDFGAAGDESQVWVSTAGNSVVVGFTNAISPADIGKTIELFGVGAQTTGKNSARVYVTNHTDMISIITNVIGTNAWISGADIPQVTSNGVYCVYGTNNADAFQRAADFAGGTNTVIKIPAGRYLMIPPEQYQDFIYAYRPYGQHSAALYLNKGGLHFLGEGMDKTILVGQGAYKNQGYHCMRGTIFSVNGPITNDYPLVWDSLTFDGGLQTGYVGHEGTQPANWVDGIGWDGFSAAGLDQGKEPLNSFKEFVNCRFQHFRGEMIKGITGSARNESILVTNCVFTDGNATAFNYNFAHTITGCTFSNLYQIEEFYLKYPTNAPSFFVNNYATNIIHNLISLNGGTLTNEPYIISNNVFYCNMNGNGIATCPASHVFIVSNQFLQVTNHYTSAIVINQAGAQPGSADACNTNIIIAGNIFRNPFYTYISAGGVGPTNRDRVENVQIYGNTIISSKGGLFLDAGGWAKNIHVYSNDFGGVPDGQAMTFRSGGRGSSFALVELDNNYWKRINMNGNGGIRTNYVSYGQGSRWLLTYRSATNAIVCLVDTNYSQIPPGAQMLLTNATRTAGSVPIYLNSAMTREPVMLDGGQTLTACWTNGEWKTGQ